MNIFSRHKKQIKKLTLCHLENFSCFLLSAFFSSKSTFLINSFRDTTNGNRVDFHNDTIRVSNRLDPDQGGCFVGPDLGPNCLQRAKIADTLAGQGITSKVRLCS